MRRHAFEHAPLVRDVLPSFAAELERLLAAESPELAAQVVGLRITGRCSCGDSVCASFDVMADESAPLASGYRPGVECLELEPATGIVIADVEGGRLQSVEVLNRPDVRGPLAEVAPSRSEHRAV